MKTAAEKGGRQPQAQGRLEPPEAGRGGKDPPLEPLEGAWPWDTLTSDVWSPALGEDGCLLLKASRFVLICYGGHRELPKAPVPLT